MRLTGSIGAASLVVLLVSAQSVLAEDLKVLVLDALNGKPQERVKVEYFCTRPQHNSPHLAAVTANRGLAVFPNPCSGEELIEIAVYPSDKKEQCGAGPALLLKQVLSVGVVTNPGADGGIWCPAKISKTTKRIPGQVVLFVKKPTWWQSHIAGE